MRAFLACLILVAGGSLAGCASNVANDLPVDAKPAPGTLPPLAFSLPLIMPGEHDTGEPNIAIAPDRTIWIAAPAGSRNQHKDNYLWFSKDGGATWQINELIPMTGTRDACRGGGDDAITITPDGSIYLLDLFALANNALRISRDGGQTFICNQHATAPLPGGDREWIDHFDDKTLYMVYNLLTPTPMMPTVFHAAILRSDDAGLTWIAQQTETEYAHNGNMAVDKEDGTVYFVANDDKGVALAVSTDKAVSFKKKMVADGIPSGEHGTLFDVVSVDRAGNVYVAWNQWNKDGGTKIYYAWSSDKGDTWSKPILVRETGTNIMPWMTAGDDGRIAIAWYHIDEDLKATDEAKGDWFQELVVVTQARSAQPTITLGTVGTEPVHQGNVCSMGTFCLVEGGNRRLLDFFELAMDPEGRVLVSRTVTTGQDGGPRNLINGQVGFAAQTGGPSLIAATPIVNGPPLGAS